MQLPVLECLPEMVAGGQYPNLAGAFHELHYVEIRHPAYIRVAGSVGLYAATGFAEGKGRLQSDQLLAYFIVFQIETFFLEHLTDMNAQVEQVLIVCFVLVSR